MLLCSYIGCILYIDLQEGKLAKHAHKAGGAFNPGVKIEREVNYPVRFASGNKGMGKGKVEQLSSGNIFIHDPEDLRLHVMIRCTYVVVV